MSVPLEYHSPCVLAKRGNYLLFYMESKSQITIYRYVNEACTIPMRLTFSGPKVTD